MRGVNKRTITYTNRESNQHTSSAHSCKQNTITTTPLSLVFLSLSMIYDQFLWGKTFEIYQIRPSEKLLYHYMKVGHQSYTKSSSSSCHLPAFESGTVTTCDNLYDECDHILTNLVRQNIKKFEKKSSNAKKHGKGTRGVILDVFRPPNHDPSVCFPSKNIVQVLPTLSIYAVVHCRHTKITCRELGGGSRPPRKRLEVVNEDRLKG